MTVPTTTKTYEITHSTLEASTKSTTSSVLTTTSNKTTTKVTTQTTTKRTVPTTSLATVTQSTKAANLATTEPAVIAQAVPTTAFFTAETPVSVKSRSSYRNQRRNRHRNRKHQHQRTTQTIETKTCLDSNGVNYRGHEQFAKNGDRCKYWSNLSMRNPFNPRRKPSKGLDANYCRNPDGDVRGPWCYVEIWPKKRFQYCDIKKCQDETVSPLTTTETKSENSSMINSIHSRRSNLLDQDFRDQLADLLNA